MKKINQISWNRYKNSKEGQEVIALFNHLCSNECTVEEMLAVIKRFDPEACKNMSKKEEKNALDALSFYDKFVKANMPKEDEIGEDFKWGNFYLLLTQILAVEDEDQDIWDAPQVGFKNILGNNIFFSMVLYSYIPEYYLPNLFVWQFIYLKKIAEKYEIEMPETPNRSDYRMRWMYYLLMCIEINKFAIENDLQDGGELCAFLYDYELPVVKEDMKTEHDKPMPKIPEQAWILVGNYSEGEKTMESGFWQSNELTHKGDIMLFYEKSPVKQLNAVWRALEDGFVDPFGHYYSFSYIGRKIEIPCDKAITFEEFKSSDYFKNREKKGNFVSKNFQDVSGWAVTSEDYAEIKRMLEVKGFDTSILPSLYEPKQFAGVVINNEKDVEDLLLKPLLEQMGWKYNVDYFQQVEFPAGHGTTGHKMNKRPDFCLHMTGSGRKLGAKVVIEVKDYMKTTKEIDECYEQGLSYAKFGEAEILVLCDRKQIRVYERNKKGKFDDSSSNCIRFSWKDIEVLEKFNELKRLLSK